MVVFWSSALMSSKEATVIRLRHATKTFGSRTVLNELDMTLQPGRITGFLGKNGSGKTTLFRCLLGISPLDSGTATINNKPLVTTITSQFGYLPEERGLYPQVKVVDQLRYFARLKGQDESTIDKRINYWLDFFNITHYKDQKVQLLSLGNQQRVQIIVALLHDPSVLLLDEPFSGLDPATGALFGQVLRDEAKRGKVIVLSSHQLDVVQSLCDDIAILHNGKIELEGSLEAIQMTDKYCFRVQAKNKDWLHEAERFCRVQKKTTSIVQVTCNSEKDVKGLQEHILSVSGPIELFQKEKRSLTAIFHEVTSA
jgi:ABC-2 type transport system ATP-binding protein